MDRHPSEGAEAGGVEGIDDVTRDVGRVPILQQCQRFTESAELHQQPPQGGLGGAERPSLTVALRSHHTVDAQVQGLDEPVERGENVTAREPGEIDPGVVAGGEPGALRGLNQLKRGGELALQVRQPARGKLKNEPSSSIASGIHRVGNIPFDRGGFLRAPSDDHVVEQRGEMASPQLGRQAGQRKGNSTGVGPDVG